MRLKNIGFVMFTLLMTFATLDAEAQRNKYKKRRKASKKVSTYRGGAGYGRFKPHLFIGANINAANYFGDLAPVNSAASTDIAFTSPGIGFYGGYQFHKHFSVRGSFNWMRLRGDDFNANFESIDDEGFERYARNLSFRNDIKEAQLSFQAYLFPNNGGIRQRPPINAFLSIGLAAILHEPRGKVPEFDYQLEGTNATTRLPEAGEWVKLRPLGTEGQNFGFVEAYSNFSFAIPVSIGVDVRLPGTNLNAGIEAGMRYTFTDYLDDVSTNYVDLEVLDANGTNTLARIMSDRSSEPNNFDGTSRDIANGIDNLYSSLSVVNLSDGYWRSGYLGGGTTGAVRGNDTDNDLYFVTQLKLTYFLDNSSKRRSKRGRGRAKFR